MSAVCLSVGQLVAWLVGWLFAYIAYLKYPYLSFILDFEVLVKILFKFS